MGVQTLNYFLFLSKAHARSSFPVKFSSAPRHLIVAGIIIWKSFADINPQSRAWNASAERQFSH
jgi:hypothetical protein